MQDAPADVQSVKAIGLERAVGVRGRNSGFVEELFKVGGGHNGLISAGYIMCRHASTAAFLGGRALGRKKSRPEGLSLGLLMNLRLGAVYVQSNEKTGNSVIDPVSVVPR